MAKRFYPQQQGERKKAKLDISVSDHNFPLSQNNEFNKESNNDDNWGDDNDDEILLLASQACEQAYNTNDVSLLPDYSMCMQPSSTSTQLSLQPTPSTSRSEFSFKKPSFNTPTAISTHLKEKCNRISSPLPGISSKVMTKTNGQVNVSDDLIFNDKVFKSQDTDHVYRQLIQMQEENAKLKSENGKLLEKCVTKEGEASILRTQLKSCQTSVDNARLEKIKAQEKVQMEWTEKLTAANKQMHDLRTQLDFKNLEIISIKEKCKKLESTKVKLTQVTVTGNDISQSHNRYLNNSTQNDLITTQSKRMKMLSSAVQTENHAHMLRLHRTCGFETQNPTSILSYILEPSENQHHSILDYNEKLQKTTDLSQNKCRIYSTFHRVPSTPAPKEMDKAKVLMSSVYEDVTCVVIGDCERIEERYFNIFTSIKSIVNETRSRLETVCQRVTTSFQKEMDERYMELTADYQHVAREDLLRGRALYKEEQEILSRRMVATLSYVLESSRGLYWFSKHEQMPVEDVESTGQFVDNISRICVLIDNASCATLYSGLLLSITTVIEVLLTSDTSRPKILEVIKTLLTSRPMPFVVTHVLSLVRTVSAYDSFMNTFCPGNSNGNLKTDFDQGVLLYKKDSCFIQVLLKQIEACMKCIEKQKLIDKVVDTTQHLMILYSNVNDYATGNLARGKSRCDCQLVLVQVIVYALRICVVMLDSYKHSVIDDQPQKQLLSVCRCGVQLLYQCAVRDVEFSTQLSHNEGHLLEFCEHMRGLQHGEACANMLAELAGTLQSSPEDMPPLFHRQPWLKSFEAFSLVD